MLKVRVIPVLLLKDGGLVKTRRFRDPRYVGDPINAIRIFNDKGADELFILDIVASRQGRGPSFQTVEEIASECFMPLGYGGGVRTVDDIGRLLATGVEKVSLNTAALGSLDLVAAAAAKFGSQAIVVSIDVRHRLLRGYEVYGSSGERATGHKVVEFARRAETAGAGEILLTSIDRDGTGTGYDLKLLKLVSEAVRVPVVASGGAGKLDDFRAAVVDGGASAVAAGRMFVFYGKHQAVLINYPTADDLARVLP
jgi:imidazole glycerol-phosphate synthase subunit HisF